MFAGCRPGRTSRAEQGASVQDASALRSSARDSCPPRGERPASHPDRVARLQAVQEGDAGIRPRDRPLPDRLFLDDQAKQLVGQDGEGRQKKN